jgi:hypothetical protein
MLRLETVEPHTFSILTQLMKIPELENFSLVGGPALSLLYGHRVSVDLDLFSNKPSYNRYSEKYISGKIYYGGQAAAVWNFLFYRFDKS